MNATVAWNEQEFLFYLVGAQMRAITQFQVAASDIDVMPRMLADRLKINEEDLWLNMIWAHGNAPL